LFAEALGLTTDRNPYVQVRKASPSKWKHCVISDGEIDNVIQVEAADMLGAGTPGKLALGGDAKRPVANAAPTHELR
jgi:hypothetical protein